MSAIHLENHTAPDPSLVAATFSIEGDNFGPFAGFHDPRDRWNGWVCPRFSREVAQSIADLTNSFARDPDDMRIEWDGVGFVETSQGESTRYDADKFGLFCVGAWSWCWDADEVAPAPTDTLNARVTPKPARIAELRAVYARVVKATTKVQLSQVYIDQIGYCPFCDDAEATIESVRARLFDYLEEVASSEGIHWSIN